MASYMFTKLLPKEVLFKRGESPSPDKLNGIFDQIGSAAYILESFLGNGTDYRITTNSDRKLLFNVSSAIGQTEKLYKPASKIPDLQRLLRRYIGTHGSWNDTTKTLTITEAALIPSDIEAGDRIGIYYTGRPRFTMPGSSVVNMNNHSGGIYDWEFYDFSSDANYFQIEPYPASTLSIRSFYIAKTFPGSACYNTGYTVPISNANYYTVKTPCVYSNPALTGTSACSSKVTNYCIGNTYEYTASASATYGTPICSGANKSYSIETASPRSTYLTIQCPLNTTENKYALKFRPFSMHSISLDTLITPNMCIVYDIKDAVNPIKYNTSLYSAGESAGYIRGDIFYTPDKDTMTTGDNNKYLVLGGNYGLTDMVSDLIGIMDRQLPIGLGVVGPATYES
jgi:hypothetical protein